MRHVSRRLPIPVLLAICAGGTAAVTACSGDGQTDSTKPPAQEEFGVALILKTSTNPFFVSMARAAAQASSQQDLHLTTSYGRFDGDEASQVSQIEAAITRKDKGILITPNGPGVDASLKKARAAGMLVVALDTPPSADEVVDVSYATDNFQAGLLIGRWSAKKMAGTDVRIAMLNLFDDKIVSSDVGRSQGFLTGMGIPVVDREKMYDEPLSGTYSGGKYTISCAGATLGAEDGGANLMRDCLKKDPAINLVYTINEPAAIGAISVLREAQSTATVVSVDGGCEPGVAAVLSGDIAATAQQYPTKMAAKGVDAVSAFIHEGSRPVLSATSDFVSTGETLVTNDPQTGVPSLLAVQAKSQCWGKG